MKPFFNIPFFLLVCFATATAQTHTETLTKTIFFDFDEAVLRPLEIKHLQNVVAFVRNASNVQIRLEGHTDSYGSDSYNVTLSEARVTAVRHFLLENGVPATQIQTMPLGESRPLVENISDDNRQLNRRVTVFATRTLQVVANTTPEPPQTVTITVTNTPKSTPFSPLSQIEPQEGVFHFYCHQDTVLTTTKGSKIFVEAYSFDVDCQPETIIELKMTEVLEKNQMLQTDLHTLSDDNVILESFGMFELQAFEYETNRPIELKETQKIGFEIPTFKGEDGVEVYNLTPANLWKRSNVAQPYLRNGRGYSNLLGWVNLDKPVFWDSQHREVSLKVPSRVKRESSYKATLHVKGRNIILPFGKQQIVLNRRTVEKSYYLPVDCVVEVQVQEQNTVQKYATTAKTEAIVKKTTFFERVFKVKQKISYETDPRILGK